MSVLLRRLPNLSRQLVRNSSGKMIPPGYREGINPDISHIKKLQAQFQVDDGVPIWLKRGTSDYILFYLGTALAVGGLGHSLYILYSIID